MTELQGNEVQLGMIASWADLQPKLDSRTVTPDATPRSGGNAAGFGVLFGGNFTSELPHGIHFGMASTALYGGNVAYSTEWSGRGYVVDASLVSLLLQPTLAYAFTDWLSLGAGPAILYTRFEQRVKVTSAPGEPTLKIDGADGWSAGAVVSALIKPFEGTRIGLFYRSQITAKTDGPLQGSAPLTPTLDTEFTFPHGVNVSLYQQINDTWAVLVDGGWSDWSKFGNIPLQVGPIGVTEQRNWNDTWRIAIGGLYTPNEKWTIQSGFGYDSSPVKSSLLLPDIPAGEQYRFSAGLQYRPTEYLELSFSYQFLWFANLDFDGVALPPADSVVLFGTFDPAWANQVGVTVSVKF